MRWDGLFDDLEAQAAAAGTAERAGEVDERTRGAVGELTWRDRALTALGSRVRVRVRGGHEGLNLDATLSRVGSDWLLLADEAGRETVIAAAAVLSLRGLGRYARVPGTESAVSARLGLRHALRGIARDRSPVRIHLDDGSTVDATIDRVGADFIEVATHAAGELRRRTEVRDVEILPLPGIVAVRRSH